MDVLNIPAGELVSAVAPRWHGLIAEYLEKVDEVNAADGDTTHISMLDNAITSGDLLHQLHLAGAPNGSAILSRALGWKTCYEREEWGKVRA